MKLEQMAEVKLEGREMTLYHDVPRKLSDSEVLNYLQTNIVDAQYINAIKNVTAFTDETISNWFNVSVKTFRSYKDEKHSFKENTKEQMVLLLSLMKHGLHVFDTREQFEEWLSKPNFFFDSNSPISFLTTVSGIRFVNDRITALEYGDNV